MRRSPALALVVIAACSVSPRSVPSPAPSRVPAATVAASEPPASAYRFDAARALAFARRLADAGPREATSAAFMSATAVVRAAFVAQGYRVRTLAVPVRAGYTIVEPGARHAPVRAGRSLDVIAEPIGFDPYRPFTVVGAHVDTVPGSPGANDNASGVAVTVELARIAALSRLRAQVVFVAFGAEERRRQSASESEFASGSRAYVDALPRRAAPRAMIDIDMVGAGARVELLGDTALVARAVATARSLSIPARRNTSFLLSDHLPFAQAGIPTLWFWAGDHPSFHSPSDTIAVVSRIELARVGILAWHVLQSEVNRPVSS